jgi:hypothetical protein
MTREEAIAELNTFKIGAKSELGENALDMAIKALEQEPCGKDINVSATDAISREAVEDAIIWNDEKREMLDEIQKLPSVQAKQKTEVLDKIRAEIEKTISRYTISRERGAMGQVEWSDRLIKESEVLEIIDKYKAESEK